MIFKGIALGVANVIPGVSGGTMAVVFNVYDRIIDLISPDLKKIFRAWKFWLPLAIGMCVGVLGFSKVITILLEKYQIPTTYFFIGLILGSIPLILRKMKSSQQQSENAEGAKEENTTESKKRKVLLKFAFLIGLLMVLSMKFFGGDIDARKAAEKSNAMKQKTESVAKAKSEPQPEKITEATTAQTEQPAQAAQNGNDAFNLELSEGNLAEENDGRMTVSTIALLFVAGVAAAIAMIIPGISGSFLILALGMYGTIISAVARLDVLFLLPFALGALVGIIFGASLVRFLMEKIPSHTYAAILGLIVGSVVIIFPGVGEIAVMLISVAALALGFSLAYFSSKNE
ncbi:MAG: DUF368 domain-containing protein [Treponema sp.]|nr:DUF368 domain-containing protein [Treponema sp.]